MHTRQVASQPITPLEKAGRLHFRSLLRLTVPSPLSGSFIAAFLILSLSCLPATPAQAMVRVEGAGGAAVGQTAHKLLAAHQTGRLLRVMVQLAAVPAGADAITWNKNVARTLPGRIWLAAPSSGFVVLDVTPRQARALLRNPGVHSVSLD